VSALRIDVGRALGEALERFRVDARVLVEVAAERVRQDEKWGEQNHPDGTGLAYSVSATQGADRARRECRTAAELGMVTWRHILAEEVAEVLAEDDEGALRTELVQLAAVCVQWAQAIDRRLAAARLDAGVTS
jgi:hypothetical protein